MGDVRVQLLCRFRLRRTGDATHDGNAQTAAGAGAENNSIFGGPCTRAGYFSDESWVRVYCGDPIRRRIGQGGDQAVAGPSLPAAGNQSANAECENDVEAV